MESRESQQAAGRARTRHHAEHWRQLEDAVEDRCRGHSAQEKQQHSGGSRTQGHGLPAAPLRYTLRSQQAVRTLVLFPTAAGRRVCTLTACRTVSCALIPAAKQQPAEMSPVVTSSSGESRRSERCAALGSVATA